MRSAFEEHEMKVSEIRAAAKSNIDEFERSLRVAGDDHPSDEDASLVDLARRLAPVRSSPDAQAVSPADLADAATLQTPPGAAPDEPRGTASASEAAQASEFFDSHLHGRTGADPARERRSGGWSRKVSALAPAGAALVGATLVIAVFGPERGAPVLPKAPPFIAAAHGPAEARETSGDTAAASSDAGIPPKDIALLAEAIRSEKRPIGLSADASHGNAPSPPASPVGAAQPAAGSAGPPVDRPVVAAPPAATPPAAAQNPDPEPVRMASAPPDAAQPAAGPAAGPPVAAALAPVTAPPVANTPTAAAQVPVPEPMRMATEPPEAAQPAAAPPVAAAVAPAAAPLTAPPPAAAQVPDPEPVRTASAPPGATPSATAAQSATASLSDAAPGEATHATDAPQWPARPASVADSKSAPVAQPATPKLDRRARLSRRPSARAIVARTEAPAPAAAAETRSPPLRPAAPTNS